MICVDALDIKVSLILLGSSVTQTTRMAYKVEQRSDESSDFSKILIPRVLSHLDGNYSRQNGLSDLQRLSGDDRRQFNLCHKQ